MSIRRISQMDDIDLLLYKKAEPQLGRVLSFDGLIILLFDDDS